MLIRSGEARLVGWSRQMLYSGFNTLPRSVFRSADLNGRSDNTDVIRLKARCCRFDRSLPPHVRIILMKKSLFERIFGSWIVIAIVVILGALVVYMKLTDEQFPEPSENERPRSNQQETSATCRASTDNVATTNVLSDCLNRLG